VDEKDADLEEANEEMYFTHADQLLKIFNDLEENNLSLIQSCQETEETLEELKRKIAETEEKM
jgi:hypothetical protein